MIKPLTTVFFVSALLGTPADGAVPWCALEVFITRANGAPIKETYSRLLGPKGEVVESRFVGPTWQICDFGFGAHILEIGVNECFPVTIRNVMNVPSRTNKLHVILNSCPGEIQRNYCELYIRVTEVNNRPVAGATAVSEGGTTYGDADDFGRIVARLPRGYAGPITVSAAGFQRQRLSLMCRSLESIQETVLLKRP